jgi:hypothetical protein
MAAVLLDAFEPRLHRVYNVAPGLLDVSKSKNSSTARLIANGPYFSWRAFARRCASGIGSPSQPSTAARRRDGSTVDAACS